MGSLLLGCWSEGLRKPLAACTQSIRSRPTGEPGSWGQLQHQNPVQLKEASSTRRVVEKLPLDFEFPTGLHCTYSHLATASLHARKCHFDWNIKNFILTACNFCTKLSFSSQQSRNQFRLSFRQFNSSWILKGWLRCC